MSPEIGHLSNEINMVKDVEEIFAFVVTMLIAKSGGNFIQEKTIACADIVLNRNPLSTMMEVNRLHVVQQNNRIFQFMFMWQCFVFSSLLSVKYTCNLVVGVNHVFFNYKKFKYFVSNFLYSVCSCTDNFCDNDLEDVNSRVG